MDLVKQAELRIKKANVTLTRHKATRMFAPFIVAGSWEVEADASKCPTAQTDGKLETYGADFVMRLPNDKQVRFLVMHENGHEFLMHLQRRTPAMKKNHRLANMAMDYAINGMLVEIAHANPDLLEMIPSALYDVKYKGWPVARIFEDLEKNDDGSGKSLDNHDVSAVDGMSQEELDKAEKETKHTIRQGMIMAGILGDEVPQTISDAVAIPVDWNREMEEFLSEVCYGRDDLTLMRYDRRRVADDLFYPDVESETVGELVLAIDTSGSVVGDLLNRMISTMIDLCERIKPSKLSVLWWDSQVRTEQVFDEQTYGALKILAKPTGGGGTRVGSVSDYISAKSMRPEAVVVFTDGYVEADINWQVNAPTLWLVTQNKHFTPPTGRVVAVR